MSKITGTVRATDGTPIQGVLVVDTDLSYSETDSNGHFSLVRPEMALFFWCAGFVPQARLLATNDERIDVVLQRAGALSVSA